MKKLFLIAPYQIDIDYSKKNKILEDICKSQNMVLLVADSIKIEHDLDAIKTIELLKECDFAIADLSYERPSCYYEIGYLQALEKNVHLICQINTPIHQLIKQSDIYQYSNLESYRLAIASILQKEIDS